MLTFVRANSKDVQTIIELQNRAFYSDYVKYGYCPPYGRTVESMLESLRRYEVFLFAADGIIVGKVSVREDGENAMYLGCLCVVPEYQGKGIGTKAISFLEGRYKDANRWSLVTPADKVENVAFYKKNGYVITAEEMDNVVRLVRLEKNITE